MTVCLSLTLTCECDFSGLKVGFSSARINHLLFVMVTAAEEAWFCLEPDMPPWENTAWATADLFMGEWLCINKACTGLLVRLTTLWAAKKQMGLIVAGSIRSRIKTYWTKAPYFARWFFYIFTWNLSSAPSQIFHFWGYSSLALRVSTLFFTIDNAPPITPVLINPGG